MKVTLTLLVASTALTAAIGLPALSAIQNRAVSDASPIAAVLAEGSDAQPVMLASADDDDDDDDDDDRRRSERDHDPDECDDDDDDCGATVPNPAPAAAVAPPTNGLFGNGAPPQVQVK